jgi:prepilin-type N-terminal cleavage/methylation domain-containing protein
MVKRLLGRKGFTLTEIMIACAILGVMASVGPSIMININRFYLMNRTRIAIQQEARSVMSIVNRSLRQGRTSTITIDNYSGQPPFSRISFRKIQGEAISYYQHNSNLYVVDSGSTRTLTKNLRFMAFSFPRSDDMDIVSVSLTLEKSTFGGKTKALQMAIEKVRVMNQ